MSQETPGNREASARGVAAAMLAYTMWGFMPIYFKVVGTVPALEVLAHRVVWAVPFGLLIIAARRQWPELKAAARDGKIMLWLFGSALVISINWLIYIVAVQRDQIFQASLGYYINPLIYVLVGVWLFTEKLSVEQRWALALATAGVVVLTVYGGELPLISLALAITFTIYGVVRKRVAVGAMPGLLLETLILFPLFFAYLIWLQSTGELVFSPHRPTMLVALLLAGPLTVLPLLFFAVGARRLPLATLGFLQFIGPTLQFAVGVYYGETLTPAHVVCFTLIWLAVALFCIGAWRNVRRQRLAATPG